MTADILLFRTPDRHIGRTSASAAGMAEVIPSPVARIVRGWVPVSAYMPSGIAPDMHLQTVRIAISADACWFCGAGTACGLCEHHGIDFAQADMPGG